MGWIVLLLATSGEPCLELAAAGETALCKGKQNNVLLPLGEFSPQLGPPDEVCLAVSLAPGLGPWPLIAKYLKSSIQGQTLNRAKRSAEGL